MQVYKEWAELMPYSDSIRFLTGAQVELLLLEGTWNFIAAGQGIFILTWLLSIGRWRTVGITKFDLAPEERRSGAVRTHDGNWIRDYVMRLLVKMILVHFVDSKTVVSMLMRASWTRTWKG